MSFYIPLATKYRPQKFADVIGQDIVVRILTQGIRKNRLGSALLFSGTRGIGKTTLARILAKAFRCEKRIENEAEPCCACHSCVNFGKDSQMDVIEIDAASNTGVDDVREIIESCRYRPSSGHFKIFIIDETHMLSKSAFNALLKTLEEPPEHVKFMLATTEIHKIPETILSRVLQFDLKALDVNLMAQYISSICNREGVSASANAVSLIAKAANGSVRDSLSILDQAINACDNNSLSSGDVREMLCIPDDADLVDLLKTIFSSDTKAAILKCREIIKGNISATNIISTLMNYIHVITCLKSDIAPLEDVVSHEILSGLKNIESMVSIPALSRTWQMLVKAIEEISICDFPQLSLEMIFIRLAYISDLPDLHEIISSMDCKDTSSHIITMTKEKTLTEDAMEMFPGATLKHEGV